MKILAIDPGNSQSGYVLFDTSAQTVAGHIVENEEMMSLLRGYNQFDILAIEMVACYGMPVGKETFETCVWIGRFYQRYIDGKGLGATASVHLAVRGSVKMHLCHSMRAKDANIRQALIDRFGNPGTKKAPGVTYGLKGHLWQAFALAVFIADTQSV
jgi:hypothetical protein